MKNQIDTVRDNLNRYHQSIINVAESDWDFFVYLGDYVRYIKDTPSTNIFIDEIAENKDGDKLNLNKYRNAAYLELNTAANLLISRIKKSKISLKKLDAPLAEMQKNQLREVSIFGPDNLISSIEKVLSVLALIGRKDLTDGIYTATMETNPLIRLNNDCISSSFLLYKKERECTDDIEVSEGECGLWNAWDNLANVYYAIYEKEKHSQEILSAVIGCTFKFPAFALVIRDIEKIKNGLSSKTLQKTTFKQHLTRIHHFLISKLDEKELLSTNNGPVFPYELPAGTTWEKITFQFLNKEKVRICFQNYKHTTNYKEMGFIGKGTKNPPPSQLWIFLFTLSKLDNNELTIRDPEAKDTFKKQKELLSKKLKSYFQIDLDPFFPYEAYPPYKHQRSYKIRMTLIPSDVNLSTPEDNEDNTTSHDLEDFYTEQTSQL